MNVRELIEKATSGTLSVEEAGLLATELGSDDRSVDRYTLLLALGRAMAKEHRKVVEGYLAESTDPMLARLALQILCKFWGDADRYLGEVEEFVRGVSWDADDDVRQMAISIAGEYLRQTENPPLMKELLTIIEDEAERPVIRGDAYIAVARAMNADWQELPSLARLPPMDALVDQHLLSLARRRAGS